MGNFYEWSDAMKKVICPFCGYKMPIIYEKNASCNGVYVVCKGRKCKKKFEIKIDDKTTVK